MNNELRARLVACRRTRCVRASSSLSCRRPTAVAVSQLPIVVAPRRGATTCSAAPPSATAPPPVTTTAGRNATAPTVATTAGRNATPAARGGNDDGAPGGVIAAPRFYAVLQTMSKRVILTLRVWRDEARKGEISARQLRATPNPKAPSRVRRRPPRRAARRPTRGALTAEVCRSRRLAVDDSLVSSVGGGSDVSRAVLRDRVTRAPSRARADILRSHRHAQQRRTAAGGGGARRTAPRGARRGRLRRARRVGPAGRVRLVVAAVGTPRVSGGRGRAVFGARAEDGAASHERCCRREDGTVPSRQHAAVRTRGEGRRWMEELWTRAIGRVRG